MAPSSLTDDDLMRRALALAEEGRATTRPNPMVGCVVLRDGEVVGEGWHERAGGPHAEVVALEAAGADARGATLYVTLEPCRHVGRTPPCVDAILAAGVRRVVYAIDDPDPRAAGGAQALRDAGIDVTGGVLEDAARELNEVYLHVRATGRPHVTLKLAQSLDGRVAAADGSSRWVTGEPARRAVHEMRAWCDAVAVGSGTVLADDPELTVRDVDTPGGQPRAVVLDRRGRTPTGARVVRPGTIVVTTSAAPEAWRSDLGDVGVDVVCLEVDDGVDSALVALAERGVQALLVEGGPTVAGSLVRGARVDRLVLHVAPKMLGSDGLASIVGGPRTIADAPRWRIARVRRLGDDLEIVAEPET